MTKGQEYEDHRRADEMVVNVALQKAGLLRSLMRAFIGTFLLLGMYYDPSSP